MIVALNHGEEKSAISPDSLFQVDTYEMVNAETFYFITYNLLLGNLESSAEVSRLSTTSMN